MARTLATPYPTSFYEPNAGVYPGMTPPPTLDRRFPDVDRALPVYVVVSPPPLPDAPAPRSRPWAIVWPLAVANDLLPAFVVPSPTTAAADADTIDGTSHYFAPIATPVPITPIDPTRPALYGVAAVTRVLEATQTPGRAHFTFWGALTRAATRTDMRAARWVLLGVLDRPTRRALERLADEVRLMKPNGWWNGQNWVVALLDAAVEDGLVSAAQRDAALLAAASI